MAVPSQTGLEGRVPTSIEPCHRFSASNFRTLIWASASFTPNTSLILGKVQLEDCISSYLQSYVSFKSPNILPPPIAYLTYLKTYSHNLQRMLIRSTHSYHQSYPTHHKHSICIGIWRNSLEGSKRQSTYCHHW